MRKGLGAVLRVGREQSWGMPASQGAGHAGGCWWDGAGCCAAWRSELGFINRAEGEVLILAVISLL